MSANRGSIGKKVTDLVSAGVHVVPLRFLGCNFKSNYWLAQHIISRIRIVVPTSNKRQTDLLALYFVNQRLKSWRKSVNEIQYSHIETSLLIWSMKYIYQFVRKHQIYFTQICTYRVETWLTIYTAGCRL